MSAAVVVESSVRMHDTPLSYLDATYMASESAVTWRDATAAAPEESAVSYGPAAGSAGERDAGDVM